MVYVAGTLLRAIRIRSRKDGQVVADSTLWGKANRARRPLWTFVPALLHDQQLIGLWERIEELSDSDTLRRKLKRGLSAPGPATLNP